MMRFPVSMKVALGMAVSAGLVGCAAAVLEHPDDVAPIPGTFRPPQLGDLADVFGPLPAPYESVCRSVVSRRRGGVNRATFVSSGALLDKDVLVTAAHNYRTKPLYWSVVTGRSIQCGAGVATTGQPWWSVTDGFDRKKQVRHSRRAGGYRWQYDYAALWVGKMATRSSSFRLPKPGEQLVEKGTIVTVAGYPAEDSTEGSIMRHGLARVDSIHDSTIQYKIATQKGMSGSPLWVKVGEEFVIVGIHVGAGRAHLVSGASLADLGRWREEFHRPR